MELVIAAEGFTLPSGYVLKEMSIIFFNREYKHFLFKKPTNFLPTPKDIITIKYTTNRFNGLSFLEGDVPYNLIEDILTPYKDYKMYTYSYIFKNFLQNILPSTTIINIQTYEKKLPANLPKPNCFRNHKARYCSLAKAKEILKIVEMGMNMDKTVQNIGMKKLKREGVFKVFETQK